MGAPSGGLGAEPPATFLRRSRPGPPGPLLATALPMIVQFLSNPYLNCRCFEVRGGFDLGGEVISDTLEGIFDIFPSLLHVRFVIVGNDRVYKAQNESEKDEEMHPGIERHHPRAGIFLETSFLLFSDGAKLISPCCSHIVPANEPRRNI